MSPPKLMPVRLTQQLGFRWIPEPPDESTDTLVLSVTDWFVDLRFSKADGSLAWGFAGTEEVLETTAQHAKCRWTHIIDSRGYTTADIGTIPLSQSGDFTETGTVDHPETGLPTSFEESWRRAPVPSRREMPWAWILQSVDGRTFLGRVGGLAQSLRCHRDGQGSSNDFCARRELWDEEKGSWTTLYEAGHPRLRSTLPKSGGTSGKAISTWESHASVGDIVHIFEGVYVIRALQKLL